MLIFGLLATLGWVGARRLRLPSAVLFGLLATLGWVGEGPDNAYIWLTCDIGLGWPPPPPAAAAGVDSS